MRNRVVFAGIAVAVLIAAGVAAFALTNRAKAPEATASTAGAVTEASTAADAASTTTPPAQTQLAQTDANAPALYPDDKILGSPDAPITMIEYASLTCPHCAHFHVDILPQIKANYIDKGLVRLVYRDFPLDGAALVAAQLAHCVPDARYFNMLDVLFRSQTDWASSDSDQTLKGLSQIGRTAGLSQEKVDSCLNDKAAGDKILLRQKEAQDKYEVESTPSFIINGEKHAGALPYEEFDTILKGKLP